MIGSSPRVRALACERGAFLVRLALGATLVLLTLLVFLVFVRLIGIAIPPQQIDHLVVE